MAHPSTMIAQQMNPFVCARSNVGMGIKGKYEKRAKRTKQKAN